MATVKRKGTGKSIYFTPRGLELLYEVAMQAAIEGNFSEQDKHELHSMHKKASNMLSAIEAELEAAEAEQE